MAYAYKNIENDKEDVMDWPAVQRSAGATANQAYIDKYGKDKSRDPEYKTGNERHSFWLTTFDARWESLILNPNQN